MRKIILFLIVCHFFSYSFSQQPQMVMDIFPGTANGVLLSKPVPWGNQAPTVSVSEMRPALNGVLFTSFNYHYWYSDGSTSNTFDITPNIYDYYAFLQFNNNFYYSGADGLNGRELWVNNGTSGGNNLLKDINSGSKSSLPQNLQACKNKFYFSATDSILGNELYVSDGTTAGTMQLKDINPGTNNGISYALINQISGDSICFVANDGITGSELWFSDGTNLGTYLLKDICLGITGSNPYVLKTINGKTFFTAYEQFTGNELWITDGTTGGTTQVKDINPSTNNSSISYIGTLNNLIIFSANDGIHGSEIWRSDGTNAGTFMLKDATPGSGSTYFNVKKLNNKMYFSVTLGSAFTLYETDGTLAGTIQNNASQIPNGNLTLSTLPFEFNNKIYFVVGLAAIPNDLIYIYEINNTVATISLFKQITAATTGYLEPLIFKQITQNNFVLYFTRMLLSDGTPSGTFYDTTKIFNEPLLQNSFPVINNKLIYFTKSNSVYEASNIDLSSHIKQNFTGNLQNIPHSNVTNGWGNFQNVLLNNKAYFLASTPSNGYELCETDGTDAGTIVYDIKQGSGSAFIEYPYSGITAYSIYKPVISNNRLFFFANDGVNGLELWSLFSPVGIKENTKNNNINSTVVYPNPTNSELNIKSDKISNEKLQIEIKDLLGRSILIKETENLNNFILNVNELKTGVYFLTIKASNKTSVTKFIKE
ncbi:MAG: T9SS type A sorting domain-containing protein [Bacteroidetes bacterium]|nr:T9SS type A sorting domain-containing protein [Bacteroidota bacterium]